MRKIFSSLLIALFFNVGLVSAQSDDQYLAAGNIDVEEKITGDFVAAGGTVNIFNDVSGDVIVAGGKVTINGNVGDDVRVAGGTVIINGNVGDDVVVYGGTVDINRNANVSGDLIAGAGTLSLDGSVKGNVRAEVGVMVVRGWVEGNVEVLANNYLQFSSRAQVGGNLKYFSKSPAMIPDGVVKGEIERTSKLFGRSDLLVAKFWTTARLVKAIWMYFAVLLIGLIMCLLVPEEIRRVSSEMRENFWKNMGIGFIVLVVGIAAGIIAAVTLIGLPLAFILFGGFAMMWFIVQVGVGVFFSDLMFKGESGTNWRLFGRLVLGLFIYTLLTLIPVFGPIFAFLLSLLAFGTFVRRRYEMLQFLKAKKYW